MMLVTDTWLNLEHFEIFLAGSTALGIVAHAVNTFPTPANAYGQWLLGVVKFIVGQRQSAMNAMRGNDTITVPVPQGTGKGLAKQSETTSSHTEVTPSEIKVASEKVMKTETVVPNPNPEVPPKGGE